MKNFKKIYIEITNVCNLKCKFCPKTMRTSEFMNKETFVKILEQIKGYGEYIYFHVKGEPLLHPNLDEFLDISYEKGFKVNITTNGTLIEKVKDKLIGKKALRQVNISLHSFGGNDSFNNMEEYISNIISFTKEVNKKTDTIIALRLWNLKEQEKINLEENKNRNILSLIEEAFNLDYKIEESISDRGIKLGERIFLNQAYEFKWPSLEEEFQDNKGYCYGLKNQIAILVDGTVVPCCLDGEGVISLGNINEKSFEEIINGERAEKILKGFSNREVVEELCRKCDYRRRFN